MKDFIRTLDFYEFDDGCITEEGTKFEKNSNFSGGTISKNGESDIINRFGK